mgnify:CR=1 FL=1
MSKVIPILEMFSALRRWTELANAVEPWQITSVVLNRAQRSADIQVSGAAGAGPNLVREAEETMTLEGENVLANRDKTVVARYPLHTPRPEDVLRTLLAHF